MAECSMVSGVSTRGGCSFEQLCNGSIKSYACDNVIDITKGDRTVQEAEQMLLDHLYRCIQSIEIARGRPVEKFYIGKTHVRQRKGAHGRRVRFDHMDRSTWRLDNGINGRWNDHKHTDYGRDGLVVLTVVTREAIHPHIREKYPDFHHEDYALALESRLIQDCMMDPRLENKTLESGRRDSTTSIGYALYMAFKVKDRVSDPVPEPFAPYPTLYLYPFPGYGGCNFEELCNGLKLSYACNNVIDITGDLTLQQAEQELLNHLNSCILRIERGEVKKFYIGKTYVRQRNGAHGGRVRFDHMDCSTWRLDDGINGRWKVHKCDDLVVLTVVTNEAIHPDIREKYPDFHHEKYALALERRLIQDYIMDPRLENKTLEPGKRDSARSIGYALYIAFKVKDPDREPFLSPNVHIHPDLIRKPCYPTL